MADDYLADFGFGAREGALEFGDPFGRSDLRGSSHAFSLFQLMQAARRRMDQLSIAWRHKLTFLGRGVKRLGFERDVGVRDARGRPIGVGDDFAAAGGDHLGWQAEEDVARVANFNRRPLSWFVEALEILRHRKFSKMGIAVAAL